MSKTSNTKTIYNTSTSSTATLSTITDSSGNDINTMITNSIVSLVDPSTDDANISALQLTSANKTTTNTFSDTQTFSKVPLCTDALSNIANDNHLATKKYVDNTAYSLYSRDNVFTGDQVFNPTVNKNVTINKMNLPNFLQYDQSGNTSFNVVPKTATDLTSSITDDKHFATKKYADNLITNLKANTNFYTGSNVFRNDVVLGDTSGLNNIQQYGNFLIHGSTTYDSIPITATEISTSITDNKHLTTKKYVDDKSISVLTRDNYWTGDNVIDPTPSHTLTINKCTFKNFADFDQSGNNLTVNKPIKYGTWAYGQNLADTQLLAYGQYVTLNKNRAQFGDGTLQYDWGTNNRLRAPRLASIADPTKRVVKQLWITSPAKSNADDIATPLQFLISPDYVTVRVKQIFTQCNALSNARGNYSTSGVLENEVYRSKTSVAFGTSDFTLLSDTSGNTQAYPVFYFEGVYVVGIMNDSSGGVSPYVRPISQTNNIYAKTLGNNNAPNTVVNPVGIMYDGLKYLFTPVTFNYDNSSIRLDFQMPNILNSPSKRGFIPSYSFYVELLDGYTGTTGGSYDLVTSFGNVVDTFKATASGL